MTTRTIWTGIAVLLLSTATWSQQDPTSNTKVIRGPIPLPIASIRFEPLVINNIEVKDAVPYPINEPELRAKMAAQFNEWIVRSVTRKHLAKNAEPMSDKATKEGEFVILMVLNIPLTHRADSSHWDNEFRRGRFMDYTLTLADPKGQVVSRVTSDMVWGDGDWALSSHRQRKETPHDEVMKGYVRKAVDRAVEAMKREIAGPEAPRKVPTGLKSDMGETP